MLKKEKLLTASNISISPSVFLAILSQCIPSAKVFIFTYGPGRVARVENSVGKGENAGNQHFLRFLPIVL